MSGSLRCRALAVDRSLRSVDRYGVPLVAVPAVTAPTTAAAAAVLLAVLLVVAVAVLLALAALVPVALALAALVAVAPSWFRLRWERSCCVWFRSPWLSW